MGGVVLVSRMLLWLLLLSAISTLLVSLLLLLLAAVSASELLAVGIGGTGGIDDIDGASVGAGIVFAVDGTGFVGAAAVGVVECVGIAIDGMWGRRGVSKIGGAG